MLLKLFYMYNNFLKYLMPNDKTSLMKLYISVKSIHKTKMIWKRSRYDNYIMVTNYYQGIINEKYYAFISIVEDDY